MSDLSAIDIALMSHDRFPQLITETLINVES